MKKSKAPKTASTPIPGTIARHYHNLGMTDNGSLQHIIEELMDRGHSMEQIVQWTGIDEGEVVRVR
jgi:hypothetical protein